MAAAISKAIVNCKRILENSVADNNPLEKGTSENIKTSEKPNTTIISFSVQIAASNKAISTRPYNFKDCNNNNNQLLLICTVMKNF